MNATESLSRVAGCLSLALCGFCNVAFGQAAEEAQITGQPLMYMKSGKVDGCGIRFIAVLIDPTLRGGRGVDGSINLWASGAAVVKGLSYDIDVAAMRSGTKAKRAQVERFWLKAPGQPATNPADGRFHNSDDEGAKLYGVKFDEGFELYKAAFEGGDVPEFVELMR